MSNKSSKQGKTDRWCTGGHSVFPYVEGLSEAVGRIFFSKFVGNWAVLPINRSEQFAVNSALKGQSAIQGSKRMHLSDSMQELCRDKVYVGETGRNLRVRVEEYKKEVEAKNNIQDKEISRQRNSKTNLSSQITPQERILSI